MEFIAKTLAMVGTKILSLLPQFRIGFGKGFPCQISTYETLS